MQESQNDAALALLVESMNSSVKAIHDEAILAIIEKRSSVGHDLILQHFHELDDPYREVIRKRGYLSPKSLRDALLGENRQVCINGCCVIKWFHEYSIISTLLNALYEKHCPHEDLIHETFSELLQTLSHDWLAYRKKSKEEKESDRQWQKIQRNREQVLEVLRTGVTSFGIKHRRTEPLQGLLLLAEATEPMFQKILENPRHPIFPYMMNLLAKTEEPNITRLLLSSYTEPKPLKSLLAVAANHSDEEFMTSLISMLRRKKNKIIEKNLRQIDSISWIDNLDSVVDDRSEEDQVILLDYLLGTKITRDRRYQVVCYFLQYGKVEARRQAAKAISEFTGTHVNAILLGTLDDYDPVVQANIIRTIRNRGIIEAHNRVFKLKNSPYEVVREAIRETYDEYCFDRYLLSYDMLDEEPRRSMGKLVYELDDNTIPLLKKELKSKLRSSRARALSIVEVLGVADEVEDELLELVNVKDSVIQMNTLELLAQIPTDRAHEGIQWATHNANESVANTAKRLLER
ncbi:MAG: hypothetical protein PVH19_10655 [Planctomycetia bacterium]